MNRITFTVPMATPSLNTMLRTHWRERSKQQKAWDWYVFIAWQKEKRFVFIRPVKICYTVQLPADRARDYDNYYGGTKYATDALKRTFLTRDDCNWLTSINVKFSQGPECLVVDIEEV